MDTTQAVICLHIREDGIHLGQPLLMLTGCSKAEAPNFLDAAVVCDQLFLDRQEEVVSAYLAYDEPEFNALGQNAQVAA